jgi:hypothetical protein
MRWKELLHHIRRLVANRRHRHHRHRTGGDPIVAADPDPDLLPVLDLLLAPALDPVLGMLEQLLRRCTEERAENLLMVDLPLQKNIAVTGAAPAMAPEVAPARDIIGVEVHVSNHQSSTQSRVASMMVS